MDMTRSLMFGEKSTVAVMTRVSPDFQVLAFQMIQEQSVAVVLIFGRVRHLAEVAGVTLSFRVVVNPFIKYLFASLF